MVLVVVTVVVVVVVVDNVVVVVVVVCNKSKSKDLKKHKLSRRNSNLEQMLSSHIFRLWNIKLVCRNLHVCIFKVQLCMITCY